MPPQTIITFIDFIELKCILVQTIAEYLRNLKEIAPNFFKPKSHIDQKNDAAVDLIKKIEEADTLDDIYTEIKNAHYCLRPLDLMLKEEFEARLTAIQNSQNKMN